MAIAPPPARDTGADDAPSVVDEAALDERLRAVAKRLAAGAAPGLRDRVETWALGLLMSNTALRVGVFRLVEA